MHCYEFPQQIELNGCGRKDKEDDADEADEEDEAVDDEDDEADDDSFLSDADALAVGVQSAGRHAAARMAARPLPRPSH